MAIDKSRPMSASKQSLHHIGLRYAALASKPALIWLLVTSGRTSEAAGLGSLMLVASIIGMAMSNEAHLQIYAAIFGRVPSSRPKLQRLLNGYLKSLVTHIVLIIVPAFVVCFLLFPKVDPFLAVALALAERISDELLRIRLYRKEWDRWTILLLAKNTVPALPTLTAIFLLSGAVELYYTLGALLFAAFLLKLESRQVLRAILYAFRGLADWRGLTSYMSSYIRILSLRQVAAILSLNVVLLDRYLGMSIWNDAQIAYIVLAGQIVNGIFFILEAKYLSEHRANFIDPTARLETFWHWAPYFNLIVGCAIATGGIFVIGTNMGLLPSATSALYLAVGFMIVNYAIFYLSIPLNDYLYYRGYSKSLAFGHAAMFIVYAIAISLCGFVQTPLGVIAVLTGALVVRALLLRVVSRHFAVRQPLMVGRL